MKKIIFIFFCLINFMNLYSQQHKDSISLNSFGTLSPRVKIDKQQIEADKSFRKNGYYVEERKLIKKKNYKNRCKETGTIIAEIEVNKDGTVINVMAPMKGSTTMAPCLLKIAKKSALSMVFEKYNGDSEIQKGKITFVSIKNK